MRFYVTTAIPYVNAAPHLGHALELVQADVLARHRRLRGHQVRFLTGTDDNAVKNVQAARAAGVPVREFVTANAARFAALREPLALSFDDFIATSADHRHAEGVRRLWRECAAAGDFYRRTYRGLYCGGCEQFYQPDELAGGACPEHGTEPEAVEEENWFFRLSRYQDTILRALESGRVRVVPEARRNEVLAFVRGGLADFSVSRPAARAGGWGIGVPGDPSQVVYVWWDALANYVTALGYGTGDAAYRTWWTDADERVHAIGKGIVRFHAVYWLALLLSVGRSLPTTIVVHDYLTVDGAKIAKSAGNAVDPAALVDRWGSDALRWWLLADVAPVGDTDFTTERLVRRANQDLAHGIGNLVHRTTSLVRRHRGGGVREVPGVGTNLPRQVDQALERYDFRAATRAFTVTVDGANRLIEAKRPWEASEEVDVVLGTLLHTCRVLATELEPFLPAGAKRLSRQLTGEASGPAFPRWE
ncbi:methionine--tRNA ligase [Micromonospora sp. CPCC 205371]|nr:methionine--tRNA ligase [Micromonospora sp. CPCC 205371]